MENIFRIIDTIRTWMRKKIPDSSYRIFYSHVLIVMAIIHLSRRQIPIRYVELESCISGSSSSITRGLSILLKQGLLKKDPANDTYQFAVEVPSSIMRLSTASKIDRATIDEIKQTIKREISLIPSIPPEFKEELDTIIDKTDFTKQNPNDEETTGAKAILGKLLI